MPKNEPHTIFLSQSIATSIAPFNDPQRIYIDEHDPTVYGCTNTFLRRKVQLLDLPQRRWYEVNISLPPAASWPPPPLLEEEEKRLESMTARLIANNPNPFNTMNVDCDGNVTFETKADVGIPLRKQPIFSQALLPTAKLAEIRAKKFLFRAVDTCVWNGRNCVYKQIEFDAFIDAMQREIWAREILLSYFGGPDPAILSNHGVCPILAIVIDEEPPLLCGILLPYMGVSLDKVPPSRIMIQHLISIVKTVINMRSARVVHGDICDRNVCVEGSSIYLIDFGEKVKNSPDDIVATGNLILEYIGRMTLTVEEKEMISEAANALIREDADAAIAFLQRSLEIDT